MNKKEKERVNKLLHEYETDARLEAEKKHRSILRRIFGMNYHTFHEIGADISPYTSMIFWRRVCLICGLKKPRLIFNPTEEQLMRAQLHPLEKEK